jgi:periplasmic protein TonB
MKVRGNISVITIIYILLFMSFIGCGPSANTSKNLEAKYVVTPIGGKEVIENNLEYPIEAIKQKIEGKVIVEAYINEKGEVDKTKIVQGLSKECNEAAMEAIKKTRFYPTIVNGKISKVRIEIPILFKLKNSKKNNN